MRRGLPSAPIFLQVMALVMLTVLAVQAGTFWALVAFPAPAPAGFSVDEAARALKGEVIKGADGRILRARTQDRPPPYHPGGGAMMEPMLRDALAERLGARPEAVWVNVVPHDHLRQMRMMTRTQKIDAERRVVIRAESVEEHEGPPPGAPIPPPPFGPGPQADVQHSLPAVVLTERLVFPPFAAAMRLPDGRWRVVAPSMPLLTAWHVQMLVWLAVTVLVTAPAAFFLARRLTRPIRVFAEAAERLGADPNAPPLKDEGPLEVRQAVAAFNDMQGKIRTYVEDRTSMVAAIAHDLRTPLTRLRFRIESAPEEARKKAAEDIAQMDGMIAAALAYVRGESALEARVPLDLSALLGAIADDAAELGQDASFDGVEDVVVVAEPIALKRLFGNLVDNALKFGGKARVGLSATAAEALVTVEDDGPGIPAAELERVFEPFHRGEPSRSRETGGSGLGLAVARAIARAHGGDVTLANRDGGGLLATVRLPRRG